MAKILCAYSGINFTVEHFPVTLTSRESYHPIFDVPQKKLLSYLSKWAGSELTPTDSYLLFLALLKSSESVEFRVPVYRHELTASIVAKNMESLATTVIKLNAVANPSVIFPHFAITPETKGLLNIHHWIEAWQDAWKDFQEGNKKYDVSRRLVRREAALEKLIKNPHKTQESYAKSLAEWASEAGTFPTSKTLVGDKQVPLSEYWKQIIVSCSTDIGIYSIPLQDIRELLFHCESEVPIGTIFSHKLFHTLRKAIDKQANFLGIDRGERFNHSTTFEILDDSDTIETANISAILQKAPTEEPKQGSYPTKLTYLRAKLAWQMSERMKREDK
jgi:hypothetical protein